ncbi:Protein N-acetyltransferase, RimJ/RimL family [Polaromonas sp. YR568]|uniref:GNAT family N-acetyltransferase n=1 Tax=Polaromonas sp. YR568 TaxID=1855301 RepID=UPI0008F10972|nr:GNAT family protein [Polaromonas sp. YR568]SFU60854.1 Protein N-acetyltransferase, RimJ/RimL family [Polaromonas sp. YR568]
MSRIEQPQPAPSSEQAGPRLETARLILRSWHPSDIPALLEGLNDFSVAKWLAFVPHPYTLEDAGRWVEHCKSAAGKPGSPAGYEFAIELKSERKAIGGVSLRQISPVHGTAGGGIWLSARYHGHGYGSEAFGEKIRFAFEDLQLRRLDNGFFKGNGASLAMQQRFGYKVEGERRQAYRCVADGELKDEVLTGLIKDEWKKG